MIRLPIIACFLAFSVVAKADDPKTPPVKKTPAGLRVAGGGNSWYAENCTPYANEAGIQGHQAVRTISQYGQRPAHDTRKKPLELAEAGEIDVFVWGRTDALAGNGTAPIKMVTKQSDVFAEKEMNRWSGLDENQVKILQKPAWETVSKYPHAGVSE